MRRRLPLLTLVLLLTGCALPDLPGHEPEPVDPDRRPIGSVQGRGDTSPLLGREVVIEGTVVRTTLGDKDRIGVEVGIAAEGRLPAAHGWFVQDEGDGDPVTSDGLFVADDGFDTLLGMPGEAEYTTRLGTPVRSGDRIKVRGVVAEWPLERTADTPQAGGAAVSRGRRGGTVTTVVARSISIVLPEDRPELPPLQSSDVAEHESAEGMRLRD